MAVLDTNVIIDLAGRSGKAKQSAARKVILAQIHRGEQLFVTCFSHAELAVGIYRATDPAAERQKLDAALGHIPILDFTPAAVDRYGWLVALRQKLGEPMETIDALIAAVTMAAHQSTLITRNIRHFDRVPGLTVESY